LLLEGAELETPLPEQAVSCVVTNNSDKQAANKRRSWITGIPIRCLFFIIQA